MILEKNWKTVCNTIEKYYINKELALYTINEQEKCIDIALYDDIVRNENNEKSFRTNHLRYTEITTPNMNLKTLERIKKELERNFIKENVLYEIEVNEVIYQIGDNVIYENNSYGKIVDINPYDANGYCYGVVFPDIYLEDRPFWAAKDEIKTLADKEKIKEIDSWYFENHIEIWNDMNKQYELEAEEELE